MMQHTAHILGKGKMNPLDRYEDRSPNQQDPGVMLSFFTDHVILISKPEQEFCRLPVLSGCGKVSSRSEAVWDKNDETEPWNTK
jgi:hypothetical protein